MTLPRLHRSKIKVSEGLFIPIPSSPTMNAIKTFMYLGVILTMLSPFLKAFGMSKAPEEIALGATRQINLSGNIFSFAMPENFSRDMPAEPLIENLDLNSLTHDSTGLLMQRWWDIKEPGFFGKALGTVMMTINVYKVPENTRKLFKESAYDITDRTELVFMIDESIRKRYKDKEETGNEFDHNLPGIFFLIGTTLYTTFREEVQGRQKWTGYSIGGASNQLLVNSVLPIDEQNFIEISFNYSPNNGVVPRYFRDWAYKITSPIEESFHMKYKSGNALQNVVEKKWLDTTAEAALRQHKDTLVKRILPADSYEQYRIAKDKEE